MFHRCTVSAAPAGAPPQRTGGKIQKYNFRCLDRNWLACSPNSLAPTEKSAGRLPDADADPWPDPNLRGFISQHLTQCVVC